MKQVAVKVRLKHDAENLPKAFGMTDKDWNVMFDFVFDRWERGKSATEIIEAILNKADFSFQQKTLGVYIVGSEVGEARTKMNMHHALDHMMDGDEE